MGTRKMDIPGLGPTEVIEVGFRALGEHWNEYLLDDGTTVRLKLVVTTVYKVPDQYDAEGNPAYLISSTNVLATNSPDDLRQKQDGNE